MRQAVPQENIKKSRGDNQYRGYVNKQQWYLGNDHGRQKQTEEIQVQRQPWRTDHNQPNRRREDYQGKRRASEQIESGGQGQT